MAFALSPFIDIGAADKAPNSIRSFCHLEKEFACKIHSPRTGRKSCHAPEYWRRVRPRTAARLDGSPLSRSSQRLELTPMLCRPAVDLKHTSDRVCVCSVTMAEFQDVLSYYEWVERLLPSNHVRKSGRDYLRAIARVKYKGYPFLS